MRSNLSLKRFILHMLDSCSAEAIINLISGTTAQWHRRTSIEVTSCRDNGYVAAEAEYFHRT